MEFKPIIPYRFDLLFSYWIFAWYLLYMFNVVSVAPKLTNILAIIVIVCYMISINVSPWKVVLFISLMKGIPLWTLRNKQMQIWNELIIASILLVSYVTWLYINKTSIYDVYYTRKIHPVMTSVLKGVKKTSL